LSQAGIDERVRVTRISEYAENVNDLLKYLNERGLRPGAEIKITDVSPLNNVMTLSNGDKHFSIGSQIADAVWVTKH
jgi:Fe2+ transport system protein FeoA